MSATITIQLSPNAIALSDKFKRAPQEFPQAIKRGMTRALAIVSGRIQEKRLTGHGPFPVTEHRLGERTGQLKLRKFWWSTKTSLINGRPAPVRIFDFAVPLLPRATQAHKLLKNSETNGL